MTSTRFVSASLAMFVLLLPVVNAAPTTDEYEKTGDQAAPPTCDMPGMEQADAEPVSTIKGDPFSLKVCPVSGEKLGKIGDAVVRVYDGREVRFCCSKCPAKFEADKETYLKKIDSMMVKDQLAAYPLDTCVISGESLIENGEDVAINMVYQNRLVRLCCKKCATKFKNDPAANMAKLDAAVIAAQSEHYPLDTCVVSGTKLGGMMGDPIDVVIANRLVRICCNMHMKDLLADPSSYVKKVDAAWAATPGGMPSVMVMMDENTKEVAPKQIDTEGGHPHRAGH